MYTKTPLINIEVICVCRSLFFTYKTKFIVHDIDVDKTNYSKHNHHNRKAKMRSTSSGTLYLNIF